MATPLPIFRIFLNFEVEHQVSQVTSKMSNCETPVSPNPSCRRKRRQLVEFTLCDAILTVISLAIYIADIITG